MKEIESKAWVRPEKKDSVFEFLEENARLIIKNKIKKDIMYTKKGENAVAFRLRMEDEFFTVTRKTRKYTESGTEVNEELEFTVTNAEEFQNFAHEMGYTEMYRKEKRVDQYRLGNMLLEYVKMSGLPEEGDLLECEIVCNEDASKEEIAEAENKILAVFTKLHIADEIEKRPYGKLLKEF